MSWWCQLQLIQVVLLGCWNCRCRVACGRLRTACGWGLWRQRHFDERGHGVRTACTDTQPLRVHIICIAFLTSICWGFAYKSPQVTGSMFPVVADARKRNIRTPERRINGWQRFSVSPSDGILPHSLSPGELESSVEQEERLEPDIARVGSSWMLHRIRHFNEREVTAVQTSLENSCANKKIGCNSSHGRGGHYGFNATVHTSDRAVALACVNSRTCHCMRAA
jgi:hypothetical protein